MSNLPKFGFATQQGWECPRCHKVNAPYLPQCFCSLDAFTVTHATKVVVCQHESDGKQYSTDPRGYDCKYKCIKCGEYYR